MSGKGGNGDALASFVERGLAEEAGLVVAVDGFGSANKGQRM